MSASRATIPDCRNLPRPRTLSARQRRDLVRLLAQRGIAGLEEWLKREEQTDPHIRDRVKAERDRLEREARAERRRVEQQYEEGKRERETSWERRMRELSERENDVRTRLASLAGRREVHLDDLAARSRFIGAATGRGAMRPLGWLRRLWLFIVTLWVRFLSLFQRERDRAKYVVELPDGVTLDLSRPWLIRPELLVEVRQRMRMDARGRERVRRWWRRLLGREDYSEVATRLMREEMISAEKKRQVEIAAETAQLEARLAEVERESGEAFRREREDLSEIESTRDAEMKRLAERIEHEPYEQLRDELLEDLADAGLVSGEGAPTESLLERFATLLYDEARRSLPAGGTATPGMFAGGEGEYEKGPLRSLNEMGAIDLVDSLVQARVRHPRVRHIFDEDALVHREVRTSSTHVVLIFDQSGSMEEKDRLEAAKRVCLVMYRAVKDLSHENRVDILAMHTSVERVDLTALWAAEPKGFTNHGAALRMARDLLEQENADRRLVYLITDGLPEALTLPNGVDRADSPRVCMPYAKEQARLLADATGARVLILQLETEDELYLDAARELAAACGGEVEGLDPEELTRTLLVDLGERARASP